MAKFSSPEVIVNKSAEEVYTKFSDMNNLKELLPSEIDSFESTTNSCKFKIKNMPEINLEFANMQPYSHISIIAKDSQIPFFLNCFILEKDNQSQVRLEIDVEVNILTRGIIEKPLTKFLNILAEKLQNL
tara:strand:+ start:355 stop:744 length:390 start_codon:yes stop_codon:yes gene_type:complete